MSPNLPEPVVQATALAHQAGFTMSCEPETGALLAVLAAAVPAGGRILELGTGAGVGTAWITHGLSTRTDVGVVTIDNDQATADLAAKAPWPPFVRLVVGDAVRVTAHEGTFDLIFADAQGGKWDGLDVTLAALRPGGQLLLDDMTPTLFANAHHEQKTVEVRTRILDHPDLVSVPISWSTGLILSTRRRTQPTSSAGIDNCSRERVPHRLTGPTNQSRTDQQRRDPIHIVPYDPDWPAAFERQRLRVESVLRPWLVGPVEHIGSTSVPGLAAKPIIDMLARIPDYHTGDIVGAMSSIGWTHAPEPGDEQSRKWSFCFPDICWRTHHLHIFEAAPENWQFLLTFRDYLRNHPDDAAEYGRVKEALAAADAHDRPRYRAGKAPFIEGLLHRLNPSGDQTRGE